MPSATRPLGGRAAATGLGCGRPCGAAKPPGASQLTGRRASGRRSRPPRARLGPQPIGVSSGFPCSSSRHAAACWWESWLPRASPRTGRSAAPGAAAGETAPSSRLLLLLLLLLLLQQLTAQSLCRPGRACRPLTWPPRTQQPRRGPAHRRPTPARPPRPRAGPPHLGAPPPPTRPRRSGRWTCSPQAACRAPPGSAAPLVCDPATPPAAAPPAPPPRPELCRARQHRRPRLQPPQRRAAVLHHARPSVAPAAAAPRAAQPRQLQQPRSRRPGAMPRPPPAGSAPRQCCRPRETQAPA
mmetsp:Transcript_24533/g.92686  ORF Transcript_24533/g.92686 Transcript_24533/m.92686 type:complete len:298 (+) Transcript_24533:297-1190(+)